MYQSNELGICSMDYNNLFIMLFFLLNYEYLYYNCLIM